MQKVINFLSNKKIIIKKIFFTLFIIFIYVIGTQIYIPFLDQKDYFSIFSKRFKKFGDDFSVININSLNLFSLSIFPYITASIIVQFLQKIFSFLKEWSEQGEKGKYKINLMTRSLTFLFALAQGWATIESVFRYSDELNKSSLKVLNCLFFLLVGVFICIWLSDLITSKGIGNGVSILIVVGITNKLFDIFKFLLNFKNDFVTKILILFLFLILLIFTIILYSGYFKIPINYVIEQSNNKIDKYIPIKVNTSGVLPIILADTFLNITQYMKVFCKNKNILNYISIFQESRFNLGIAFFLYLLLIMLFSFFSSFMTINPIDIAEHLSKQNAYLKDTKPGTSTVKKITCEIFKITLIGTVFLTLLAVSPDIINFFLRCFNKGEIAQEIRFGGTSLLIVVGTAIETIQSIKDKNSVKKYYNKFV